MAHDRSVRIRPRQARIASIRAAPSCWTRTRSPRLRSGGCTSTPTTTTACGSTATSCTRITPTSSCINEALSGNQIAFLGLSLYSTGTVEGVMLAEDDFRFVGDTDGDGTVDFQDLGVMKALSFGPPGPSALAP